MKCAMFTKDPERMGTGTTCSTRICICTQMVAKKPCCVALGGVRNRFHTVRIQVVHITGGGYSLPYTCRPARESILRARDGDIIMEYFFQLWKPIFKYKDLVFNIYYSSSMY